MSSFLCSECGAEIIDTPRGYVTECPHWPLERKKSVANLETLAVLTGQKSISDMTDEELREHIRQIRHARLIPTSSSSGPRVKKTLSSSKAKTTKSPMDALLRSLSPEEVEELMKMLNNEE